MALPVSDGFRGEEWASLGPNWTVQTADDGYFAIRSNCLAGGDINATNCSARWNADTFDADQYAQATLARLQESGGDGQIGPAVRMTPEHYYALLANYYETELVYVRTPEHPSGPLREVLWYGAARALGEVLKLEADGTTLRAYANGSLIPGATVTDTRIAGGTAGVACRKQGTTSLNDWSADNLSVTPPEDQPPAVTITKPASAVSLDAGTTVVLAATATDAVDGSLSASVAWTSDLDGALGTGASVQVDTTGWSTGARTITASATNSKSLTGTATRALTIGAASAPTLIPLGGGDTMIVTQAEPTAALRTVPLQLHNPDGSPATGKAGSKPMVSIGGAAGVASANALTAVDAASGRYALVLSATEVASATSIYIYATGLLGSAVVQVLPGAATNSSGQVQVEVAAYASGKAPPTATEVRTELEKAGSTLATVATDTAAVKTSVAGVKAKTDNIPAAPATEATAAAAKTAAETTATDTAALKTSVAAVKSKTDALPTTPAAKGDAMALAPAERASVAGAVRTELTPELARIDKPVGEVEATILTHGDDNWIGGGGGGDGVWTVDQRNTALAGIADAKTAAETAAAKPAPDNAGVAAAKAAAESAASAAGSAKAAAEAAAAKPAPLSASETSAATQAGLAAHGFGATLMQMLEIAARMSGQSWTAGSDGTITLTDDQGKPKYRIARTTASGRLAGWNVTVL